MMESKYTGVIVLGFLALGFILFSLLRRPQYPALQSAGTGSQAIRLQEYPSAMGVLRMKPATSYEEPRRYRNKETRLIEYNGDGLPTKIEIVRDYAIP
jgi:hypothetical protein